MDGAGLAATQKPLFDRSVSRYPEPAGLAAEALAASRGTERRPSVLAGSSRKQRVPFTYQG